jgi:phospholipase/carboxylesterase
MASSVAKRGERVLQAGAPLSRATGAMILLHGRGASGQDMLHFAEVLAQPDFAYLAPQAEGRSWYPYSFLAPIEQKEPYLTSSMLMIDSLLADLSSDGFTGPDSFARLLSRRLSGARIRRPARRALRRGGRAKRRTNRAEGTPRDYLGHFSGTPVFLGCGDTDPHIPTSRVQETGRVLTALGAAVIKKLYRGMGHTINDDEVAHIRAMVANFGSSVRA